MIGKVISTTILPLLALVASAGAWSQAAPKQQLDTGKAHCEGHRKAPDGSVRSGPEAEQAVAECRRYVAALKGCHATPQAQQEACIDAYTASLRGKRLPDKPNETMK